MIPIEILSDRTIFPPEVSVTMQVTVDFGSGIIFSSQLSIGFLRSPIEMKVQTEYSSIFDVEERLVIDFTASSTADGITVEGDEWEWEWDWVCMIPGERGESGTACVYQSGNAVVMPGNREAVFRAEEGERLQEGEPLYFSVRSRVRVGGQVLAEGRWSGVVNPVEGDVADMELVEDSWTCPDSSVGFLVLS